MSGISQTQRYAVGAEKGFFEGDWVKTGGSPDMMKSGATTIQVTGSVHKALDGWKPGEALVPTKGYYHKNGHWFLGGKSFSEQNNVKSLIPLESEFMAYMAEHLSEYANPNSMLGYGIAGGRDVTHFGEGTLLTFWTRNAKGGYGVATLNPAGNIKYTEASPHMLSTEYHTVISI